MRAFAALALRVGKVGRHLSYSLENARSLLAVAAIVLIAWLVSENKRRFPVMLLPGALALQAGIVLLMFALPGSKAVLNAANAAVVGLADAADQGSQFVFGYLGGGAQPYVSQSAEAPAPFIFGFRVLPLVLLISALSALLWHWGVLSRITQAFGVVFRRTMGLSGHSALAVAANIFMGMIETPIVIRAYLDRLTRAELFLMMVVGLSTIAGSMMVAYSVILQPVLADAAGHVLTASVISAPAGVLLARIIVPEVKGERDAVAPPDLRYEGAMDALTRGVQNGVMVAVNVAASLIVFVALVGLLNNLLTLAPDVGGAPLTLQRLFGYAFAPVAYAIGLPWHDAQAGGALLGTKLFLTEFIAFIELGALGPDAIDDRSRMIMTYAICGFANVASIGIMTGGMTTLMPERRSEILELAWKALLPGFMATLMTAAIVAALPAQMFAR